MLLTATSMWRRASAKGAETPEGSLPKRSMLKIGAEGLGVGVSTGFFGVGGGFLIVPTLVLLGGLSMRRAAVTNWVIIALKSAAGFWKYLDVLEHSGASVNWTTIGVFISFGAAGSVAGKSLNERINQQALQRGLAVFLVVMAGFIAVRESVLLPIPAAGPPAAVEEVKL